MRFSTNSIAAALRAGGLSATLAMGAGLAGCDSGNGGGGGGGSLSAANISTTDGAVAQASNFAHILGALDTVSALSVDVGPASTGGVSKQAVSTATDDCPNGGSASDTGPTSKNVNSPYTQKQISVHGVSYANCKYTESQQGITSSLTINGSSEGGSVLDGAYDVSYTRVGESQAAPLSFSYDTKFGQLDLDMTFGLHLRDDYKEGTADEEGKFLFNIDGSYSVSGSAGGQTIPATTGEFRYYFGTEGAPFETSKDSSGITVSGEYGSTLGGALATGLSCPGGSVQVSTKEKLVDNSSGASPFSAGTLELSAGGSKATVKFNNNNTVTVTAGSSSPQTLTYAELLATSAPCTSLSLAGLYMASGFRAR